MFALDLFNTKYERELREGALDDTISRTQAHLMEPLSKRAAEIRTQLRGGKLRPMQIQQLEREYEDLVDKRMKILKGEITSQEECMGYGGLVGEAGLPDVANKQAKMARINQPGKVGTDVVTPQQRMAGVNATMPRTGAVAKAKDTASSFFNWLAGKDDTGPTYESIREAQADSRINAAKYVFMQLQKAYDDNVDIATIRWMNNPDPITFTRNQIYHVMEKLKGLSRQKRNQFALQTLADRNEFALWLGGQKKVTPRPRLKPQTTDPFQTELPLDRPAVAPVQERAQKKNSKAPDISATAANAQVSRELKKIRARYPAARSDIEALAANDLDNQDRNAQQLDAIKGANTQQDELLKKLIALDQQQGREIDDLDSENDNLEAQLARIQGTNDRLQKTIQSMTGTKKSTRAKKPAKTEPEFKASAAPVQPAEADPEVVKKIQGLEKQISQLQSQPASTEINDQLAKLQLRLNALYPVLGDQGYKPVNPKKKPKLSAPTGDQDITPIKYKPVTKTKQKAPANKPEDDFDILDFDRVANQDQDQSEPDLLNVKEGIKDQFDQGIGQQLQRDPAIRRLKQVRDYEMMLKKELANRIQDRDESDDEQDFQDMTEAELMQQALKKSRLPQAAKEYIEKINDPTGPVYRAFYRSYPKGARLQDELCHLIADKYGVSIEDLQSAELKDRARRLYGKQLSESRMKDLLSDLDNMTDAEFVAQYQRPKQYWRNQMAAKPTAPVDINDLDSDIDTARVKPTFDRKGRMTKYKPVHAQQGMRRMMGKPKNTRPAPALNPVEATVKFFDRKKEQYVLITNIFDSEKAAQDYAAKVNGHIERIKPVMQEGYQDFKKPEPYYVCLAGRPVKRFDYYEQARQFHDNWKKKLYREGNTAKAEKITLMPVIDEGIKSRLAGAALAGAAALGSGAAHAKAPDAGALQQALKQQVSMKAPQAKPQAPKVKADEPAPSYPKVSPYSDDESTLKVYKPEQYRESEMTPDEIRGRAEKNIPRIMKGMIHDYETMDDNSFKQAHGMTRQRFKQELSPQAWKMFKEAANPAQQAAIAINMKKHHVKPKHVNEDAIPGKMVTQGFVVEYDPATRTTVISKRGQELDRFSFKGQPNLVSFQRTVAKRVKDLEDDLYGADGEAGAVSLSRVKVPGRGHSYQSLGEDSSTSSDEAESAILKRIMVAHLDLLKEFGPQKVMQAVEEVAYNVGDLDEIGSSDVSGWVHQVKDILGVPEDQAQLDEKWSAKYKRSIDCSHPKGFSQKAHCAGRKK